MRRNQLLPRVKSESASCARELLAGVDPCAERVQPGRRVVDVRPRIQRRDVHAVAVDARLNAVVDDRAERRPDDLVRIARGDPAERGHLDAAAERLQPRQQIGRDLRHMMHHPAQVLDVELLCPALVGIDDLCEPRQILHAVLVAPLASPRRGAAPRARRRPRRAAPPIRRSRRSSSCRRRRTGTGSSGARSAPAAPDRSGSAGSSSAAARVARPSRCSSSHASYIGYWSRFDRICDRVQRTRRREQHLIEVRRQARRWPSSSSRRACCACLSSNVCMRRK